ncbi:MAG: GDSL-type esterase/lipase family protein [Bacteroidales bacterium]
MERNKNKHRIKIITVAFTVIAIVVIVATPLSTETMAINKKIKRISRLTNYGLNKIIAFQETPNLPLITQTQHQIRIVHIGDSHIQAGFFTGEVRQQLANYFGDTAISVGYAFPYNLAKTNSPTDYTFKSTGTWIFSKILGSQEPIEAGLSGMTMKTSDPTASLFISTKNKKYGDKYFDQITIFYRTDGNSFTPKIENISTEITSKGSNHITYKLNQLVCEANIILQSEQNSSEILLSGLELVNSSSKIIYSSAGLNGADVKSYLLAKELTSQLGTINPQLVIISLGTNDAYHPLFNAETFTTLLDSLITKVKKAVPNSTVLLTIPGDHLISRAIPNPRLLDAKTVILTSALRNNCCVWDFHSLMGGAGSIKVWNSMGLTAPDMLHLNAKGYQLQGELLFEALTNETSIIENI